MSAPVLYLFGGSNGAGKTTFARAYWGAQAQPIRFLNADEIARGLSPFAVELVVFEAGRLLLNEVRAALQRQETFALESTLSGRTYISTLREAREAGFTIHLNYLWLRSPTLAVRRVQQRVRKGGHSVPEVDSPAL